MAITGHVWVHFTKKHGLIVLTWLKIKAVLFILIRIYFLVFFLHLFNFSFACVFVVDEDYFVSWQPLRPWVYTNCIINYHLHVFLFVCSINPKIFFLNTPKIQTNVFIDRLCRNSNGCIYFNLPRNRMY